MADSVVTIDARVMDVMQKQRGRLYSIKPEDAWEMFLEARSLLIAQASAEGKSCLEISQTLSCDAAQVHRIKQALMIP
jgi:hypothetical protein